MCKETRTLSLLVCILTLFSLFFVGGCAKEQFAANKSESTFTAPLTLTSNSSTCANHSLIRPNVDILFLWDNTSSQIFVSDSTKAALTNTINYISPSWDYHILMAPLILNPGQNVNTDSYLISYNTVGLTSDALSRRVDASQATTVLNNFNTSPYADEKGLERAADIITANVSNGIFRQDSYVIIVLMSNGDDRILYPNGLPNPYATSTYVHQQKDRLLNLRDTTLDSLQMRFLSMVAHQDACSSGWRLGASYIEMSSLMYTSPYPDGRPMPTDQGSKQYPDSYNICNMDFLHIFDGPNNTITDVTVPHKYNYWPISSVQFPLTFDPNTIRVQKSNGDEFFEVPGPGNGDGWNYVGYRTNQIMNFEPLNLAVEVYTGHVIELYGNARVSFPECLVVSYDSPIYYYGYVGLNGKPITSSIVVKKNGVTIPESATDGWEYIGYQSSLNIKVQGPNNPSDPHLEALPAETRTNDHFIKMNGSAIYQNGDNINVIYDPDGT